MASKVYRLLAYPHANVRSSQSLPQLVCAVFNTCICESNVEVASHGQHPLRNFS